MAKRPKKSAAATDPDAPEGKKSKKKILILVLVIALAGGGYYMTMGKKTKLKTGTSPTTIAPGPTVGEPSLTVNLTDGHYLEFTPVLQLANATTVKAVNASQARILDMLLGDAATQSEADLLAPGGADRLKATMVKSLDGIWPSAVTAVYFTQFVMQ